MFTKDFEKISKKDVDMAGGKGASLGEMTQAGLAVPPGFVVLASAFDKFLAETDLNVEVQAALKKTNPKDIKSIESASVKIRDLIRDAEFPDAVGKEVIKSFRDLGAEYVAVRSSATAEDSSIASWAGELETYLNVTEDNLLESVKKCWSSLFTPRAIFYRYEKNLHERKVSVAVVIQEMVQSEVSGICFTVHPVTEDANQLVIEAGWGLGEAIVGGMITPDTYIVNKAEGVILDINISRQEMKICRTPKGAAEETKVEPADQEKQKLDNENILKLAALCQKIEKHYGSPQDIEWAYAGGKFYITQSRPITTLSN